MFEVNYPNSTKYRYVNISARAAFISLLKEDLFAQRNDGSAKAYIVFEKM